MLIIIDMQRTYLASNLIVQNVCNRIIEAKERHEIIVLVEYRCFACRDNEPCWNRGKCNTHRKIINLIQDYENLIEVQKEDIDGSDEIIEALEEASEVFPRNVNICGVNTGCCVRHTVEGLVEKCPNVNFTLLLDACNDDLFGQKRRALFWTKPFKNTPRKNSLTLSQK